MLLVTACGLFLLRLIQQHHTYVYNQTIDTLKRSNLAIQIENTVLPDSPENQRRILHVANLTDWHNAATTGSYKPSTFESEGFTHCCFDDQLSDILETYYSDQSDYLVLELTASNQNPDLKIERASNGDQYPHIYGSIPVANLIPVKL